MRVTNIACGAIAIGLLFTSACGGGSTPTNTSPIVVGAALGFSGPFQVYDGQPFNAAKLLADKINKAGGLNGRQITFVKADTKSVPANSAIAAQEVLSQGAEIVLVSCDYAFGGPGASVAIKAGKLAFSVCAGSTLFGPVGLGKLAFTIGTSAQSEGAASAEFASQQKHWSSVYTLLDPTGSYETEYQNAFLTRWKELGGTVKGQDSFKNGDTSIASQVAKIKSVSPPPDFILLPTYLPGGGAAVRQIRAAGVNVPILANNGLDGTEWLSAVPGLKDFYFSNWADTSGHDSDPAVNAVTAEYAQAYGSPPTVAFAYMGYALMQVLQKAITATGTTDGDKLANYLETLTAFQTVVGPTTFTTKLHISMDRTVNFYSDEGNKTTFLIKIHPSSVPPPPV